MKKCGFRVLSLDRKLENIIISKQTNFKDQGMRPILKITLEDGTILKPSKNHPILTSKNKWIKAKDLQIGDKLKCGPSYPLMDIDKEMIECKDFEINTEMYKFNASNKKEYFKMLAFARILGLVVTDGHIPEPHRTNRSGTVYVGAKIDIEPVLTDLELITNIKHETLPNSRGFTIYLCKDLSNSIRNYPGIPIGNKIETNNTIPDVDKWPKPVLREFLGAMFGGNEYSNNFLKLNNSLIFKEMLKIFDICDIIQFSEQIGFRYCAHKTLKLSAIVSYIKLKNTTNGIFITPEAYFKKIGVLDWFVNENNTSHKSPTYAVDKDAIGLPTFQLEIISIEDIGEHQAYDLEIINTENFIANGVITHNCMITHGMSQFLKEVLLDKSDIYDVYVCDLCGLFAQKMYDKDVWYCPACPSISNMTGNNNTRISKIVIPYAFKLLAQELMSMNVAMRIRPKKTIFNIGMH